MFMEKVYRYVNLPELEKLPTRKRIVVFSGAGISVESGVASFRDKDGLWQKFDWRKLASAEGSARIHKVCSTFTNCAASRCLRLNLTTLTTCWPNWRNGTM